MMDKKPLISVIVPVYNPGEYLKCCIDSILKQTVQDFEIILVDDGSSDGSPECCDRYAREDSRIRVLHQPNSGVSIARNNGLEMAKGTWIMFADSDDWLPQDSLEILLQAMEQEEDCDMVVGSHCRNYPDYETFEGGEATRGARYVYTMADFRKSIIEYAVEWVWFQELSEMQCDLGGPCAKLYRSSFLKEHGVRFVPHQVKSEDHVFNLHALQHARKLVVINLPVYHYRIWDESFCQRFGRNQVSMEVMSFWKREVDSFIRTYGYGEDLIAYFSFQRAKQMSMVWLDSYMLKEITWQQLRKKVGSLEENGFQVAVRNPYYSKVHYVYAIALKYNLCSLLLAARRLVRRIWG